MVVGLPPFYSQNRAELFDKIKFSNPNIPPFVSVKLRNLFENLFQKKPENRLCSKQGAEEIKKHPWFQNINWNEVINKKIKAPFVPLVKSEVDVSNFDTEFTECDVESACSSPVTDDKNYEGFSFNKSNEDKMDIEEEIDNTGF